MLYVSSSIGFAGFCCGDRPPAL